MTLTYRVTAYPTVPTKVTRIVQEGLTEEQAGRVIAYFRAIGWKTDLEVLNPAISRIYEVRFDVEVYQTQIDLDI